MNWKSLLILIIIAAAAVWGVMQVNQTPDSASSTPPEPTELFAGLQDKVNDVDAIRIIKAGNEPIVDLKRGDHGWVVANKHDYPAELDQVRDLLVGLVNANIIETKTSNPELYERLGVRDVAQENVSAKQIDIAGLDQPLSLIVGHTAASGRSGTYVRRTGEAQSYLVSGTIEASDAIQQWLQQPIVEIPADRLQRINLQHPDGEVLTVAKQNRSDTAFKPLNLLQNRELQYETIANPIGSVLSNLRAEDVMPAAEFTSAEDTVNAEFFSFDGLKLNTQTFMQDDQYYVRLSASFDAEQAQQFADSTNTESSKDEPNTSTQDNSPIMEEAQKLNQTFDGWVYRISKYKYDNFTKRLNDLLKEEEAEQQTEDGNNDSQ